MLLLFSMIGIACFAGALHYTCIGAVGYDQFDKGANITQRQVHYEGVWHYKPDAWTTTTELFHCPKTLHCAVDIDLTLLANVSCVKRLDVLGEPLGE